MRKYWRLYLDKFDTLSMRERVLIYASAAAIVVLIADTYFLSPLSRQRTAIAATMQEQRDEIVRVEGLIEELRQRRSADPDAGAKQRISEVEARIASVDQDLAGVQTRLIAPERMPDLLRALVRDNRRLELVSLTTLPATPLLARDPNAGAADPAPAAEAVAEEDGEPVAPETVPAVVVQPVAADEANIYKHGVEVVVSGRYADFLTYLDQLEALPWQLYWGDLHVDGRDYPKVRMRLLVYTLSLEEAWLKL